MVTKSLTRIILLSFILYFLHMIEVVWSEFPTVAYSGIANYFSTTTDVIYFSTHIPLFIFFMALFFFCKRTHGFKWYLVAYSWIFIAESHHFIRALVSLKYYPGAATSLLYVLLGCYYIRQLHNDFKRMV